MDRSVFLMGSVIRAWQGLGGPKLTRLMAEQTAQSQAALPMSFYGVEQEGFPKLGPCPEKPLVCCLCLSYWVFPSHFLDLPLHFHPILHLLLAVAGIASRASSLESLL